MSILSEIIDGASGDAVSTDTLLRKALVVASRLQSADLKHWVRSELDGYDTKARETLPSYRGPFAMQADGLFTNEYGTLQARHQLGSNSVEDSRVRSYLFDIRLFQPIAELEDLARTPTTSGAHPTMAWDQTKVGAWNALINAGQVPRPGDLFLFSAQQTLTQAFLTGVIGQVRTALLSLALDLEETDPAAGTTEGPTVADAEIANTVRANVIQINNYGSNSPITFERTSLTTGDATVIHGDVESFVSAAAAFLSSEGLAELRQAATAPPAKRESRLKRVLQRVEDGAIKVATGVGTNVAVSNLTTLTAQFLGTG
ncbi:hypothetical protein [Microbacterium oleivorans]|uniref:AbiTii domain-containing protein n=1 Tax=Microbacterium oleivorans TaxID=273677 RepID=A0A031FNW3_9MICO|nr:hypothetical protein [Microbacterium oleivorans]EZP26253.1 hypothetical protein BW34_02585 [Microbacterium oleivorans]